MPDAYDIPEAQFLQRQWGSSGVGGLSASIGPVPAGKCWTIFSAFGVGSVAETRVVWFAVSTLGVHFPVTTPTSFAADPAISQNYPFVREGMEFKLFQNEYLAFFRGAATAGSTITIYARLIESDMPFYREVEKHAEKMRFRRSLAASGVFGRVGRSSADRGESFPPGRRERLER